MQVSNTYVIIRRNEERTFDTSSDYVDTEHPLCLPKVIVFLHLVYTYGANYFDTIRNWDKEKNKLLELYGYSLNDDLKGKFEFTYKEGKPYLRVLDTSIKRVAVPSATPVYKHEEVFAEEETDVPQKKLYEGKKLGIVFNFNKPTYPFFTVDVIEGEAGENGTLLSAVEKLDLAKYINLDSYPDEEKALVTAIRKLQETEINKYINRNSPFSGFWENIVHHEGDELPEETKTLIAEYLVPRLKKLSTEFSNAPLYILPKSKTFKTAYLQKTDFSTIALSPQFFVAERGKGFEIECFVKPEAIAHLLTDNEAPTNLFFLYNHQLYLWKDVETASVAAQFLPNSVMKVDRRCMANYVE